ncbi:uncharacterized protein LOC111086443 [Limulus polyphemus]|uniref:Uncharacterized protein LOC111086443 n=1 Tax=Limulus polyphemus TaxID=6850 RepID=A0ABM1SN15_LIMPO|nr:uncharacterized protein LOC111086443 [Limulus polyphemus]
MADFSADKLGLQLIAQPSNMWKNRSRVETEDLYLGAKDDWATPSGGQQPRNKCTVHSTVTSRANNMSTDTLPVFAIVNTSISPVKSERASSDVETPSPSVSPNSPSSTNPIMREVVSVPQSSPVKQVGTMSWNYSDFMRSLAAKYKSGRDSQTNGSVEPYKSSAVSLFPRTTDDGVLQDTKICTPYASTGDFASSKTLLHLVRTVSAQSASQLENYLRRANKNPLEEGQDDSSDPLDLSTGQLKRPRVGSPKDSLQRPLSQVESVLQPIINTRTSNFVEKTNDLLRASPNSSIRRVPSWVTLMNRQGSSPDRVSPANGNLVRNSVNGRCLSLCIDHSCSNRSEASDISRWTVDDVVAFVLSLESCTEYSEKFKEQSIDGASLSLLTEEHLTTFLGMKLGPALKLRASLARRIGHCTVCMHCIHCHSADQYDKFSET